MQTLELTSADTASSSSLNRNVNFSASWLLRRIILWVLLVGLGVAGSCLLYYSAAGSADVGGAVSQKSTNTASHQ